MKVHSIAFITIMISALFHTAAYAWSPEGYPYQFSGNLNYIEGTNGSIEDGWYLEMNAEQGIDVYKINTNSANIRDAVFNVFVSGNIKLGGDENGDPWNRKIETDGGIKFRIGLKNSPPLVNWGNISIGAKINHINYLFDNIEDDLRYMGFVSWGLGGNWKTQHQAHLQTMDDDVPPRKMEMARSDHNQTGRSDTQYQLISQCAKSNKPHKVTQTSREQEALSDVSSHHHGDPSESKSMVTSGPADSPYPYYVQVGAWKNLHYAREVLDKVSEHYPDAYLVAEKNFMMMRIPGVMSKTKGAMIVNDISARFDLMPMVMKVKKAKFKTNKLGNAI